MVLIKEPAEPASLPRMANQSSPFLDLDMSRDAMQQNAKRAGCARRPRTKQTQDLPSLLQNKSSTRSTLPNRPRLEPDAITNFAGLRRAKTVRCSDETNMTSICAFNDRIMLDRNVTEKHTGRCCKIASQHKPHFTCLASSCFPGVPTQTEIERGSDKISLNRPTLELIVSAWVKSWNVEPGHSSSSSSIIIINGHVARLHVAYQLETWHYRAG